MEGQCREYKGPWYSRWPVWVCVVVIVIVVVCCYVFLCGESVSGISVDELIDNEDYTYDTRPVPLYDQWLNYWLPSGDE
ncbi:unnamed protein product [Bean-associated cytorhabdovirus]|uniref:Uncharacterized protein n=1 Tax=Cytorhabdovirus caricae TaxID=2364291 RepID=A0A7M4CBD0_9RHAB|nr:unnamed protein product [Bean-associated cytorhabdovirus]QOD39373.1 hypothetical protein [Cytorhabdovirus caricae]